MGTLWNSGVRPTGVPLDLHPGPRASFQTPGVAHQRKLVKHELHGAVSESINTPCTGFPDHSHRVRLVRITQDELERAHLLQYPHHIGDRIEVLMSIGKEAASNRLRFTAEDHRPRVT